MHFQIPDGKTLGGKVWTPRNTAAIVPRAPFPRLTWVMFLCVLCFHCSTQQPRGEMRKPPFTQGKDPAGQATTSSNTEQVILAQPLPAVRLWTYISPYKLIPKHQHHEMAEFRRTVHTHVPPGMAEVRRMCTHMCLLHTWLIPGLRAHRKLNISWDFVLHLWG